MKQPLDKEDIPVAILMFGIVLLSIGMSHLRDGLGLITAGVLLVLYVKPIFRWYK